MEFVSERLGGDQMAVASPARPIVVIPAFNEAATIEAIVRRVLALCGDVVVVDDGSSDDTGELLARLPVRVLRHDLNRGKGASLFTGMCAALEMGADAVLTMDGDGQHLPESIAAFLARAQAEPDCIIAGSRLHDRATFPPARLRANEIANFWISWASGQWIEDSQCGFRLYPRKALELICAQPRRHTGFAFESEVLIDASLAGFRVLAVPIPAIYGSTHQRPSHFRPVRDITIIVLMVAGKLLARCMYPKGLIASTRQRRRLGR